MLTPVQSLPLIYMDEGFSGKQAPGVSLTKVNILNTGGFECFCGYSLQAHHSCKYL